METPEILVSICCITYNQEKYIHEALDGFLMQKTNFKFEIIIGEDSSTDQTQNILLSYQEKHPSLINIITYEKNVGGIQNQINVLNAASGKYIAMCDGDDFWTDPLKIQKQVDFMQQSQDCVICCHYTRVIDENGNLISENEAPIPLNFDYEDVLLGRKEETRICSLMMRNHEFIKNISEQDWYYQAAGADTFLKLYALATTQGKIYVLPEVMAVYRIHKDGIWSLIDAKVRKRKMINDFNIIIKNFKYSNQHKNELLKKYLFDFFLFDIKNLKFIEAAKTIKILF
jgi:glycosyltransferase involved in cell wall biosynthesis